MGPLPQIISCQLVGRTLPLQGVLVANFHKRGTNGVDPPGPCVVGLGGRRRPPPWSPMRLICCSSSSSTNSNREGVVESVAPLSTANKKSHAQRRCYGQYNHSETNQCSEEDDDPHHGNGNANNQYPCLVLPPDYNLHFHDDNDDAAKHKHDDTNESDVGRDHHQYNNNNNYYYYYCFYSLGEKRLLRINTSEIKGWVFPWEKDLVLPREAICVGSSHGWVAYLNPRRISCPLYLFKHPPLLSSPPSRMFRLPPFETLPNLQFVRTRKADRGCSSSSSSSSLSCPVTRDYIFPFYVDPTSCSVHRDPARNRLYYSSSYCYTWKGYVKFSWGPEDLGNFMIRKLVLSCAPTTASASAFASHDDDDDDDDPPSPHLRDCIALVAVARSKLHFCKLGDALWMPLKGSLEFYDDIIYCNKDQRFYALGKERLYYLYGSSSAGSHDLQPLHGILESWDFNNPSSSSSSSSSSSPIRTIFKPTISKSHERKNKKLKEEIRRDNVGFEPVEYLVESPPSSGQLVRIIRRFLALPLEWSSAFIPMYPLGSVKKKPFTNYRTVGFDVYQLDPSKEVWNPVDCIGDHALFVGQLSHSFSLSTHHFPHLASNSIYFSDSTSPYLFEEDAIPEFGQDTGIFHLGDRTIQHFTPKFHAKTSVWVAPNN